MRTHEYHENIERPQTAKKLAILRKYFNVWLTIWSGDKCLAWIDKHWYVLDLFAGTGESHGADGEVISGSPLVFLEIIESKLQRLRDRQIRITLILLEHDAHSCETLRQRVTDFIGAHAGMSDVVEVDIRCDDCNIAVEDLVASISVNSRTPAFLFVDPFGLAIKKSTMDNLVSLPWIADILFNYMLDGIRRVVGAASGSSSRAAANAATLAAYFGDTVEVLDMPQVEDPATYARAVFAPHALRTVAFFMRWPAKQAIQYILLFACRKPAVVDIMRSIYAKEMTDQYGQATLFTTEEHLVQIEVIEP